jgi:hypothetical protein
VTTLQRFTWVDLATRCWSPTAPVLAVAASARALAATLKGEDTLCRGLRTSPLPEKHASVADCWQNSRCCHLLSKEQHSFSDTLVSQPNTKLNSRLTRAKPFKHEEPLFAWPVRCSASFGAVAPTNSTL